LGHPWHKAYFLGDDMTSENIINVLAAVAGLSASMGAGEASAHVIFNVNHFGAEDGSLAALRLGHRYEANRATHVSELAGGHR